MPEKLREYHKHGGGPGDGQKIPSKNILNLEGMEIRQFSRTVTIPSSFAAVFTDFSPRYLVITAGMSAANSGGGHSRGTLFRGAAGPLTLAFDGANDKYFNDSTFGLYVIDTAGNITRATVTISDVGWSIDFAIGDVNADVHYLVELYGYSIKYNNILQDNI